MKHQSVRNVMIQYLDGELNRSASDRIKLHLNECKQCNSEYRFLQQTWGQAKIQVFTPGPELKMKIFTAINQQPYPGGSSAFIDLLFRFSPVTLAVTLGLITGLLQTNQLRTNLNQISSSGIPVIETIDEIGNFPGDSPENFILTSTGIGSLQ